MNVEPFGADQNDEEVRLIRLRGGGLTVNVLTWGAVVQDVRLDGNDEPLVLGLNSIEDYIEHSPHFGAVAGRVANRISNASFELDGRTHKLDANVDGKHTLHGGSNGIGRRNWILSDAGTSHVTLTLQDRDGEMGFPGNCFHTCTYTLKEAGILQIVLTTATDAPTVANLAPHSYLTLNGGDDCRDTIVQIDAGKVLPLDADLVPTGDLRPVAGTGFDFREPRALVAFENDQYDINYCLSENRRGLRDVASLRNDKNGLSVTIATTEPGLQLYTGSKIDVPVPGLEGKRYPPYAGIAMEPQLWPDAPNRPGFPSARLEPGEQSRQVTEYRFQKH